VIAAFLLGLSRLLSSMWCGGAILFVLVTVREILSGKLESMVLDQVVLLRFPIYYAFAFGLLIPATVATVLWWAITPGKWTKRLCLAAALLGIGLLTFDYFQVYSSLREMLLPLGSARPHSFRQYHRWTEQLNTAVLVCFLTVAVVQSTLPARENKSVPPSEDDAATTA